MTLPGAHATPNTEPSAADTVLRPAAHRVLIVDDSRDWLDLLAAAVRHMEVEVLTTPHGREILDLVWSFRPTVVILNLGMAPLSGYQLAHLSRHSDEWEALALVALTGWGSRQDVERTAEAGFSHPEPFCATRCAPRITAECSALLRPARPEPPPAPWVHHVESRRQ